MLLQATNFDANTDFVGWSFTKHQHTDDAFRFVADQLATIQRTMAQVLAHLNTPTSSQPLGPNICTTIGQATSIDGTTRGNGRRRHKRRREDNPEHEPCEVIYSEDFKDLGGESFFMLFPYLNIISLYKYLGRPIIDTYKKPMSI